MKPWKVYYTVILSYVENPTVWHPRSNLSMFAELSRGAFESELAARIWAWLNIPGHSYDLARVELETNGSDTFERFTGIPCKR